MKSTSSWVSEWVFVCAARNKQEINNSSHDIGWTFSHLFDLFSRRSGIIETQMSWTMCYFVLIPNQRNPTTWIHMTQFESVIFCLWFFLLLVLLRVCLCECNVFHFSLNEVCLLLEPSSDIGRSVTWRVTCYGSTRKYERARMRLLVLASRSIVYIFARAQSDTPSPLGTFTIYIGNFHQVL